MASDDDTQCKTRISVASRGDAACQCVCVFCDWIVNEIDVGRGFGLRTQWLNDGTLEGWHSSQAEETNRHS